MLAFVQAITLALSGRVDTARVSIGAAVELAERLGHPHSLAHAYMEAAIVAQITSNRAATDRASRRLVEIGQRYEFPPQQAMGLFLSGWARAIGPDLIAGLELMEAEFTRASTLGPLPNHFATLLADVWVQSVRVAGAH
jgi:hypothetical protein